MRLRDLLNVPPEDLKDWGVIVPQSLAESMVAAQTGQHRVVPVPLVDGRAMFCADVLAHEDDLFGDGLSLVERDDCECQMWPVCVGMIDRYDGDEPATPPQWVQILGAGLGPVGAKDGWPVGAHVMHEGAVRVSRVPNNVNEPLDDAPSTWSRKDGQFVVPAGWQYQIGEDIYWNADWWRVTRATSFHPGDDPTAYVEITGPGGDPIGGGDEYPAWVQPTGSHDAYAAGARVTHNGKVWENTHGDGNVWEPGVFGWSEVT